MNRIIIMANNEVGVIADISRVMADNDINIETMTAQGPRGKRRRYPDDRRQ